MGAATSRSVRKRSREGDLSGAKSMNVFLSGARRDALLLYCVDIGWPPKGSKSEGHPKHSGKGPLSVQGYREDGFHK